MTMKMVNINEAKTKLSEILDAVEQGEPVLICKRNQPVAELRAIPKQRTEPRPIGLAKGTIQIPPSFFDPMPDDWLDAFYTGPVFPETSGRRVAEPSPGYASGRRKKPRP